MKSAIFFFLILFMIACSDNEKPASVTDVHEQRINQLIEAINKNKENDSLRYKLVNVFDSLKFYTRAIQHVDTLIQKDNLNSELWLIKAQLYESNKDTTAAIESYETALMIYPAVETQLYLANLLAEHRDNKSLAICTNIAKMGMGRETDANCSFIAGVYYARTGDTKKAISLFDRAINENYTLMEAYMEKGFIYFRSKKYTDALAIFEKATTVNNMYADAYYWQAKTHEAMGNKSEAITNYSRALALDKHLKEAADAIKRLER